MTRKDYVLIAQCIEGAQKHNPWPTAAERQGAQLMQRQIAENLSYAMVHDNPRFDRERFLKACGVQS